VKRCEICAYSASDHNTLRRHRMRHTGQKPYHCALCSYTAIQAISLKTHMRTKHPRTVATSTVQAAGTTAVYLCQLCRYETVNRRSWLQHSEHHNHHGNNNSHTAPITIEPTSNSNEQMFLLQNHNNSNCQLVVAPLVHVTQTVTNSSNPNPLISRAASNIEPETDGTDQRGLRHILTAISQQQHSRPL